MTEVKDNGAVQVQIDQNRGLEPLQPSGHLDQMFRQTRAYHAQLSQMADVKASMMFTLASVIVTISIRYLEDPFLRWPVLVLIAGSLVTIISAAYAVMPKLNLNTKPDLKNPHTNLLFFGTFTNLDYSEWVAELDPILHDPNRAYEAMLRDIYEMGIYLGVKKYRFIRIAYISFLTGLVLSLFTFILVELMKLQ
ncbi:MAG TPA: DUF5706 domain-containing protein [Chloroflexota bacterium]|nr:DUF5706 domain-containing protein [Chloroflexota bacterium]HUM71853.1 DUF5706 domain-containing protein [Chloroflexota bacterium]